MTMHRHLCIVLGTFKFENWHLYRWVQTGDGVTNGKKVKWMVWRRIV